MHNIFSRVRRYNVIQVRFRRNQMGYNDMACKIMLTDNELALYRSARNRNIVIIITLL